MVSSSWFRRHQKTVYIVMIFAMFVWGISYSAMELIPKKPIAKIYGRKITQNEFADMVGRWQRLFFPQAKESIVSLVWKQFMFVEEAKRLGIMVTSQEVEEGILRFALQIFGGAENIDRPGLIRFLCSNFRLNQNQIEATLKEALLVEKLESMIQMSVKITTDELWQKYSLENERVKFKGLTLKAKDFLDSVNVTEDEIYAFYEKHKNNEYTINSEKPGYKLPERVKIECLIARYDDLEKQVSVAEEEMKKYYEDNKEQFKITP
ncbi:MAG TPA: SurA N-terminal domain-containing protein, partial [Candidatus Brocadiaceae bacterium]